MNETCPSRPPDANQFIVNHIERSRASGTAAAGKPRRPDNFRLIGGILVIVALVIGPLWVGSYFDEWRWPLVLCSSAAAIVLIASDVFAERARNGRVSWLLLGLLLVPLLQGCWMWYNAWGVFSRIAENNPDLQPWYIHPLDTQPFPGLPGAVDKAEAWDRLSYIVPCLGLIWGTRKLAISRPAWFLTIARTIFWTGSAVALLGLLQRWTGATGIYWSDQLSFPGRPFFFGTFRSPGIASSYLNIALAMGLATLLIPARSGFPAASRRFRTGSGILHSLCLILVMTGAISAGSKAGAIFALLTVAIWIPLNWRSMVDAYRRSAERFPGNRRLERNLITAVILGIALLAILSFAGTVVTRWQKSIDGNFASLTTRAATNAVQLKMIRDPEWGAPGFGPGSFYPLYPYYDDDAHKQGIYVYGHNDYLQTLIEWGWLGTSAFALVIIGAMVLLSREIFFHKTEHSRSRIILMRGSLIAIAVCLIHATIDFPFQIESIAVTLSVLLGLAWSSSGLRIREDGKS